VLMLIEFTFITMTTLTQMILTLRCIKTIDMVYFCPVKSTVMKSSYAQLLSSKRNLGFEKISLFKI
jgi:hypothetical protein